MRQSVIIGIILSSCWWTAPLQASDADDIWNRAIELVKEGGEVDMAFTNFHLLVDTYPNFKKSYDAQFSLGEYYFFANILPLAKVEFEKFYAKYPQEKQSLIVASYLYTIAQAQKKSQDVERYQQELTKLALILKGKESFDYTSGYLHRYKVLLSADKIEVFVDGKLFVTVPRN